MSANRGKLVPAEVAEAYGRFPSEAQKVLMRLRQLVLEEADRLAVGPIEETLKWGEPAYLTSKSKAGSTIRLGWKKDAPKFATIYFNCKTDIIDEARAQFSEVFDFAGNRALSLRIDEELPELPVRACLARALTYHRNKQG